MGFPGGAVVKNLPAMQETQEGVGVIPVYIHTNMWDIAHVYGVCIYISSISLHGSCEKAFLSLLAIL